MGHKTVKRIGAASLVALHVFSFPAWAQVCSSAEGLGAVLSVMGEGTINLLQQDSCNLEFYNGRTVNASAQNKLSVSGNTAGANEGKRCRTQDSATSSVVRTQTIDLTVKNIAARSLRPFSESLSDFNVSFGNNEVTFGSGPTIQNLGNAGSPSSWEWAAWGYPARNVTVTRAGRVFTLPGGNYGSVSIGNGSSVVFSGPVRIKNLSLSGCNGASVTFAQDAADVDEPAQPPVVSATQAAPSQTYVNQISFGSGCSMYVAGPGRTTLNILGKVGSSSTTILNTTLSGGQETCINYPGCASSTKDFAGMDSQHPERLQINVYNGNLAMSSQYAVAAGIYVHNGDFDLGNGTGSTIVGEVLAKNIVAQNNSGTKLFSKSTSQAAPRVGAYSLTPPVTEQITNKDSLVYRALQKDEPGTSGHLQAFKLKDDSSQNTTAEWDAADNSASKMSADNRADKLRTESLNWASQSTDFEALSTTASGDTLAQACAVNPIQGACRITGDKRLSTSMVGVPWRVAPLLLGDSVLFATDDGILYSVDKSNGNLNWGWIPRDILAVSQAALSSTPKKLMEAHPWGQIASVELLEDDPSSSTGGKIKRTYVTGTALGGKLHFSIRVSNDGKSLDKVVWLDSRTNEYSPGSAGNTNDGEAGWADGVYGRPYGGAAPVGAVTGGNKVAYVVGGKLVTREVNSDTAAIERNLVSGGATSLSSSSSSSIASSAASSSAASSASSSAASSASSSSITPTSNLLYVDDNAIYFGAADGKVYKAKNSGVIETGEDSVDKVRTYPSNGSASAVWYVNGSKIASASGNGLVLLAQTKTHVTAMKYFSDEWTFAWQTGISASTKLGESDPSTNPKISVLASDNAYLSAPADIINGVVVLYYTKKPSECDIKGYTFGPLNLLDGTDARANSLFRMADMSSLDNYVGQGDATGGAFTRFKGRRAIIAGTGGDPGNSGDTAAITPAESGFRDRLNWRELTNFF